MLRVGIVAVRHRWGPADSAVLPVAAASGPDWPGRGANRWGWRSAMGAFAPASAGFGGTAGLGGRFPLSVATITKTIWLTRPDLRTDPARSADTIRGRSSRLRRLDGHARPTGVPRAEERVRLPRCGRPRV